MRRTRRRRLSPVRLSLAAVALPLVLLAAPAGRAAAVASIGPHPRLRRRGCHPLR